MDKNIKLTISYDGTNYSGWQRQNNSLSIQEVIENAISDLTGENVNLVGSGRTDAGVHAIGQVGNFLTSCTVPAEKIKYALNTRLPNDIRIMDSQEVAFNFNARLNAKKKTYMYQIYNDRVFNPFYDRYAWNVIYDIDIDLVKNALKIIEGSHDFAAFMSSKSTVKFTNREIYKTEIKKRGKTIVIKITGNGFLYNMVRIAVGSLIEIGTGSKKIDILKEALELKDRKKLGITAPAKGLFLEKVVY